MSGAPAVSFARRWWIYQRERFPLTAHGPLIAVFSASAVCYSALLRAAAGEALAWPSAGALLTAFVVCLFFFLQLRIADEHKDFAEDLAHRPYRPVQRGLVTLRELRSLFILTALVQLTLVLLRSKELTILLLVTWTYLALMGREFFLGEGLRARPILYLASHMLIMPLIDLFATGCDWTASPSGRPGSTIGLAWFLGASYANGVVIELGRKIRSPADEEPGVNTYTALWGVRRALVAWLGALAATGTFAIFAAQAIGAAHWFAPMIALLFTGALIAGVLFARRQAPRGGRMIEAASGAWTLLLYLALGVVPLAAHMLTT